MSENILAMEVLHITPTNDIKVISQTLPSNYINAKGVLIPGDTINKAIQKLDGNIREETTRASGIENGLQSAIATLSSVDLNSLNTTSNSNISEIALETTRATNAENNLKVSVQTLTGTTLSGNTQQTLTTTDTVTTAIEKLNGNNKAETIRATNAENNLKVSVQTLTGTTLSGNTQQTLTTTDTVTTAIEKLNGNIKAETIRATNIEDTLGITVQTLPIDYVSAAGTNNLVTNDSISTVISKLDGNNKTNTSEITTIIETPVVVQSLPVSYVSSTGTLVQGMTLIDAITNLDGNIKAENTRATSAEAIGFVRMPKYIDNLVGGITSFFPNTGSRNSGFGYKVLNIYKSSINTTIGSETLSLSGSGGECSVIGYRAHYKNVDSALNVVIGSEALFTADYSTNYSTIIGKSALYTGDYLPGNTAIGYCAMYYSTRNNRNIAIGSNALNLNSTGLNNTVVGTLALSLNTTGNNNSALGHNANVISDNLSNATAIGANSIVNASNKIRLGDSAVTKVETAGSFDSFTGQFIITSDARFKTNIIEDVPGLNFINKLRPVTYNTNFDGMAKIMKTQDNQRSFETEKIQSEIKKTGLIAQEVEEVSKSIKYNFDAISSPTNEDGYYTLSYASFVVPLIQAIKEQHTILLNMESRMSILESKLS